MSSQLETVRCSGPWRRSVFWWLAGALYRATRLAPHDLRRFKPYRKASGGVKQIKMLLGHAYVETTERYLGTEQNLMQGVNDGFG